MAPARRPTVAPPHELLYVAPIPQAPPGSTPRGTTVWQRFYHFRNQIDAIRNHLQPPNTYTPHLNVLTWLYFNQYVAGRVFQGVTEDRYASEHSLFSRYSRDQRAEDNVHLATIGFEPVKKSGEALNLWNLYLRAHGLPEVDAVGTGLPDALRRRGGATQAIVSMAATALGRILTVGNPAVATSVRIPQAAGESRIQTSRVYLTIAAGTTGRSDVSLGEAGPSTAAFRTAPSGSVAAGPSSTLGARTFEANPRDSGAAGPSASTLSAPTGNIRTRLTRQVEDAMISATVDHDEHLQMALQFRRNELPNCPGESDRAVITRLAVNFLYLAQPRASARDALIELARAVWDLDAALDRWHDDNGDGAGSQDDDDDDDDGQPPKKKPRVNDDGKGEGGEEHNGKGKGKGKEREGR